VQWSTRTPIDSDRIPGIDGDTIHVADNTADVRLVGFNARKDAAHDAPKSARSAKRLTVAFARLFAGAINEDSAVASRAVVLYCQNEIQG
jgi:hypothetical protein